METGFIILSTIIFLILALIWSKKDYFNFMIKVIFALSTGFGGYIIFTQNLLGV
jgi:hypothetical protein